MNACRVLLTAGLQVDTKLVVELTTDHWDYGQPKTLPPQDTMNVWDLAAMQNYTLPSHNTLEGVPSAPCKKKAGGDKTVKVRVGNTSNQINEKSWEWRCFVALHDGDDAKIRSVTFKLHPTFSPSEIRVKKAPFEVTKKGWGTFEVSIEIKLKKKGHRAKKHTVTHMLVFGPSESSVFHEL